MTLVIAHEKQKKSAPSAPSHHGAWAYSEMFLPLPYVCFLNTLTVTLCDRKRPRSTYVNKRFLSRTVASAARSSLPCGHAAEPTAGSASRDEGRETWRSHNAHSSTQRRPGISHHPPRGTSAQKTADKRKHSTDTSRSNIDCSADQEQSNVYDVRDYMRLNRHYKMQKKSETVSGATIHHSNTYFSARRTKWRGFLSIHVVLASRLSKM